MDGSVDDCASTLPRGFELAGFTRTATIADPDGGVADVWRWELELR